MCILKAVSYREEYSAGQKEIPDRRERVSVWDVFANLILSTWIRRFTKECELANRVADHWRKVVTAAFSDGIYNEERYQQLIAKF